jgi:activating signal cointegrator complex subunit 3
VGFEGVELCSALIKYRKELRAITPTHQAAARQAVEQAASEAARSDSKGAAGPRGLVGISIHSSTDLAAEKNRRRADRRHARRSAAMSSLDHDPNAIDEERLHAQANSLRGLISVNGAPSVSALPPGTTRTLVKAKDGNPGYEEVLIPPMARVEVEQSDLRVISESFEPFAIPAFPKTKTLNRIQSKVYQAAYHHNNNLLICAPTGAVSHAHAGIHACNNACARMYLDGSQLIVLLLVFARSVW